MVIYGLVRLLTTPQKRTSVGVVWIIAHVGLKRKL